jgi:hypothetical protein
MKRLIKIGLTAATLALMATSANAVVSVPYDGSLAANQSVVVNFDAPNAAGYNFVGDVSGMIYPGSNGLVQNIAAPPATSASTFDQTNFIAIQKGQSATLNTPILKSLSIFIGSLDPTNKITFKGADGFHESFLGSALFTPAQGNQSNGDNNRRFYFTFDPADRVNQIVFSSNENSFEFDNIGASAVPEPATWAMMLLGFGGIGFMLRNGKRRELGLGAAA